MNEDWREREADLRSEYEAEAAYEASGEAAYWNCKHEAWSITQEGIVDTIHWKNGKKLVEPIAVIEIKCDDCSRENYANVPYNLIISLLKNAFEGGTHENKVDIDEDRWGE
tara:strand:- start:74 stop:406 length:333 start_codon:yes stop_codon:yes gene_type:complete